MTMCLTIDKLQKKLFMLKKYTCIIDLYVEICL